ncbi:hypothetical protein JQX13_36355 [Archangium violaceum]|uniref:hypothetical protein n=1 Tax=Archangium violaceum TaxID=83451 RepID=UPI00193AE5C7|nr:hypothetical protein [Archangium violaceum]QRK05588.1 hypothetical protein JQX13_36355 [Archangium violaceum]
MYLTAHRIFSPATGRTGINAFRYRHGEGAKVDWTNPDPTVVPETEPGELASDEVEVAPGGNLVRSYLDVVAHDSTTVTAITQALDRFRASDFGSLPAVLRGAVGVRFSAEVGLAPEARPAEFDALRERLDRLLRSPPASTWRGLEPLTIEMKVSPDEETSFQLTHPAVERLRVVAGPDWRPTTIRVRKEVREDLAFYQGDILRELVRSLVPNVGAEEILRLGGVRVVDPAGKLIAEWPIRRTIGTGYCLNCHQHNTLIGSGAAWTLVGGGAVWKCTSCGSVQNNNGLWVATLS